MKRKPSRGEILATFAILPFASIYSGYVLSVMWSWFIVPTFDAPTLSVPAAMGISLTLSLLLPREGDDDRGPIETVIVSTLTVTLLWFVGFIVKQFM